MSVIVSRALPDVRDGLKPVHRRILYSMYDRGLRPDRPHDKCAKVVGDVMGTYHPHGDTAIYDALVRMVQDFSLRHPLIDGHGNFGGRGPDDGPAAMRYTECRLAPLALELMAGIDEDTVDLVPNYDGSDEEPVVLPGRFPNLLVNGSQGIAVGMATNIPPHNLGEVIDATIHVLAQPRGHPRRPDAIRQGPGLPHRRPHPGPPGHPRRLPHRPGLDQDAGRGRDRGEPRRRPHRGHRVPVPDLGRGDRAEDRRPGHGRASSTASASSERLGRPGAPPGHRAQARRQRQRGAQQPLQAHAAADQLRRQHGGPGRRGAPHPEPGPGALRTTSTTRSRWSPGASEFRLRKAREPGPHRRGSAQGHRHARRRHRRHPRLGRPPGGRAPPSWPSPSRSPRIRPTTSST